MIVGVIGVGFVGLTTAAVLSDFGNTVWAVNRNKSKSDRLKKGILPFFEPGLSEIVKRNIKANRLKFSTNYFKSIPECDVIFIAVSTPTLENGEADISNVLEASRYISPNLKKGYTVLVNKSTVPVGTANKIKEIVSQNKPKKAEIDIVSSPEFLKEGEAVKDTLNPSRILIGTDSQKAIKVLENLFETYKNKNIPFVYTDSKSAEMSKYAANAFLAMRISFINEIANICELVGADIQKIVEDIGFDPRIGHDFLQAGIGWGGACFPKDTRALHQIAGNNGYKPKILQAVIEVNNRQRDIFLKKLKKALGENFKGKNFGVLGLSYKAETDDVRDTPAEFIIRKILTEGGKVQAYDPQAMENFKKFGLKIDYQENVYQAAKGVDALLIITDWNEFKEIDLERLKKKMKGEIIIDGRNLYELKQMRKKGFRYICFGRK